MKVGFVGLGVMGGPMAGHLVAAGNDVVVWNRTAAKSEPFVGKAHVAASLSELAAECGVVFLCVNRTEDVRACLDVVWASAKPGTLVVDHSTISPTGAIAFHQQSETKGFRFFDAPITGGSMGAQKGALTVFGGGSAADFEAVKTFVASYAQRFAHVGGPGAGQTMKMANQIAVGGSLLGLCEALAFADRAGLDLETTRSLLAGGAAGSWAFDNYGPKVVQRDWSPGFSVKNQRKDFGYCFEAAEAIGASVPGTRLVDELLARLSAAGREEEATAALFDVLAESPRQDR